MPPKKYNSKEEYRAAAALRRQIALQNETEEERRARREKDAAAKRERLKNETEEHRKIRLEKLRLDRERRLQKETYEEREKRLARIRENSTRLYHSRINDEKDRTVQIHLEHIRETNKMFREARKQLLTVEPHQYEEKLKEIPNLSERLKTKLLESVDPQRIEESKARNSFQAFVRRTTLTDEERKRQRMETFLQRQARLARMSKEELEAFQEMRRQKQRDWLRNLSGEKLDKYKASVRKAVTKHQKSDKFRQKITKKHDETLKKETAQERQIRLRGYRINQAKTQLKKKLNRAGASPKRIQTQIEALVEKIMAEPLPETVSSYKPRPRKQNAAAGAKVNQEPSSSFGTTRNYWTRSVAPEIPVLHRSGRPPASEPNPEHCPSFLTTRSWTSRVDPEMPVLHKEVMPEKREREGHADDIAKSEDFSNFQEESEDIYSPGPPDFSFENEAISNPYPTPMTRPEPPSEPVPSTSKTKPQVNAGSWICPKCKEVMASSKNLTEHYKLVHHPQQQKKKVEAASTVGPKKTNWKAKRITFFCMKCSKISSRSTFQDKSKLLDHVKQKHSKYYFPCPNCSLLKYNLAKLELHLKICSEGVKADNDK